MGLAPLIDVIFLLLIFFMLTSHFQMNSGVPIKLPKLSQPSHRQLDHKVTLVLDREGRAYFKGKPVEPAQLTDQLEKAVEEEGTVELILEADKEVMHGRVVRIMDLAKQAGISTIIISAEWEPEEVS